MSEYFFGLFSGRPRKRWIKAAGKIAEKHGAAITAIRDPAAGYRGWFSCRNRGAPFDGNTAHGVMRELERKKLWPIPEGMMK